MWQKVGNKLQTFKKFLFSFVIVIIDIVLINAGIIFSFLLRFGFELPVFNFNAYLTMAPLFTVIYLICFAIIGLYKRERIADKEFLEIGVLKAIFWAEAFCIIATYINRKVASAFPTSVFLFSLPINAFFIFAIRFLIRELIRQKRRILIVGKEEEIGQIEKELLRYPKDFIIYQASNKDSIFSIIEKKNQIDNLILCPSFKDDDLIDKIVLINKKIKIFTIPSLYEATIGKLDTIEIEGLPLIDITPPRLKDLDKALKRIFDIIISLIILSSLAPLILIVAICIKLTSKGEIFYKQERVGEDGKIFNIYKFRTMIKEAEKTTGPVFATEDDKRVTYIGRFLRRYHIDEIPQFLNVLLGNMSIVGPRPERPFFVEKFIKEIQGYNRRHFVKPGITGLAQINAGYDLPPQTKLKYDLLYIKNYSLWLDFKIILKTISKVFFKPPARAPKGLKQPAYCGSNEKDPLE